MTSEVVAQSAGTEITNLKASFRSLDLAEEFSNPVSIYDTAYQNKKVQVDLLLSFSDVSVLDQVELRQGKQSGQDNIAKIVLLFTMKDTIPGLQWKNYFFPIVNNTVYIEVKVPQKIANETSFVWARAKDKKGNYSNIKTQKFN